MNEQVNDDTTVMFVTCHTLELITIQTKNYGIINYNYYEL